VYETTQFYSEKKQTEIWVLEAVLNVIHKMQQSEKHSLLLLALKLSVSHAVRKRALYNWAGYVV